MSLKVSSGLKATAQEWKPSFTPPAPAPAPAPAAAAAAVAPAAAFTQFHGEYFGPTTGYYNATEAAYGYFPSPWDLATMGQQQQRRRPPQRGQRRQQGQQQQRRKGKGQQQSQQQQQQQQQQATQFAHEGGGIPGGIPIKTKKKKKKKKKSSANAEGGSAATVMKPVEIVPNRILVFKNLPFSFTVKELEDIILAECQTTPAMTSFHRDKNGQFKGFCFVYFESIAAATVVLERLHGYTLQGRSWSIEFKRVNAEDAAAATGGATLVPAPAAAPAATTSGSGSSSLVRSGSHDGGGGGLSSMALAGALIPKLSTAGGGNGRSKYRSVSESDADMNWRRTKVESDFPPKDDVGRQIYRSMVEYKEKHAAAARTAAAAAAAAAARTAAAGSNASSSPPSSDAGAASAAAAAAAAADTKPAPLLISIATSQKTHQRLLQECLKRLNLDHRIKDEAGDDITYEITPRADALLMASTASHGHFHHQQQQQRLSMGAVGDGAGQLLQRRRRGGSTGAFPDSAGSGGGGKAGNARAAREARRTSGAGYEGSGEKTIKAAKYANLTVLEAAEQQARALAAAVSPESASASPPSAGAGAAAVGGPSGGASGDTMAAASFGMSAVGAAVRGLTRTKDRSESREFGSKIASGPDGSPGFQQGPRGRFGTPSRGNTPSSSGVASPTTPAATAASGAAVAAAAGSAAAPATTAP